MKKLLILGAGGQGKVVLDMALMSKAFNEISFLDDKDIGEYVAGHQIIGNISNYKTLKSIYEVAIVAIGNNGLRLELTQALIEAGYEVPTIIHPSAVVSPSACIGEGTVIMPQAVINIDAEIGKACIVNTGVIVEHDCQIGDGVHLSPGAILGGTVVVGDRSWICLGAKVINNIAIGTKVMVGAGAVVIDDVKDESLVVGVPAKEK